MIPLGQPAITAGDLEAVTASLSSQRLTQGKEVAAFEQQIASVAGVEHAAVVHSGTAALMVCLAALEIGPGDQVLVPGYSWVATANAVELTGARPEFVDIDPDTLAMDPSRLSSKLDSLRSSGQIGSVKAILPVHVFGYVADMAQILDMGATFEIPVIEDAACAIGATLDGRPAGSLGKAGCFSFHPLKVITTGEGGAVTTDDPDLAAFARAYRNHGQQISASNRTFRMPGPNFRMTDFQAALGRSQLNRLESILAERHRLLRRYHELLADFPVRFQSYDRYRTTGQAFTVLLDDPSIRPSVIASLRNAGIEAGTGTIAMPFVGHFKERYQVTPSDLPVTASVHQSAVSLPLFNGMTGAQQDQIAQVLDKALGGSG